MKPTEEQERNKKLCKETNRLKINACAGSGKSTQLCMIAEELGRSKLILVFNKAAQIDLASRVPAGTTVRTTHSLAYKYYGDDYQHKLQRPRGGYVNVAGTGAEIARFYRIKDIKGEKVLTKAFIGLLAKMCVAKFEQSACESLSIKHLTGISSVSDKYGIKKETLSKAVLAVAKKLWRDRKDLDSEVLITHDTYLKLYQLSKPSLNFNTVMLDEAQDTSSCVLDILTSQPDTTKIILVGDEYQNIYAWRGAINAMESVSWQKGVLSKTFRFGQKIANLANTVLDKRDFVTSDHDFSTVDWDGSHIKHKEPVCFLYRTNSKLLLDAVSCISQGDEVCLEIDANNFVNLLKSAKSLREGDLRGVKHEDLLSFADWEDLVEESEHSPELKRVLKIIEEGQDAHIISILESHTNPDFPDKIFTTAHKSKGREWDQVVLSDDFPSNYSRDRWVGLQPEERNLLYVAITRAKSVLVPNETCREFIMGDKSC